MKVIDYNCSSLLWFDRQVFLELEKIPYHLVTMLSDGNILDSHEILRRDN